MTSLWFESALLPQGWAAQVRITGANGHIEQVAVGVPPAPGDERHALAVPGHAEPAQPRLPARHLQGSPSGGAGTRTASGAGVSSCTSSSSASNRTNSRRSARSRTRRCSRRASPTWASFTTCTTIAAASPFADPGELAARIAAAAAHTGIGLTLLPVFYAHGGFGGSRCQRASAALHQRSGTLRAHPRGEPGRRARASPVPSWGWPRTACAP